MSTEAMISLAVGAAIPLLSIYLQQKWQTNNQMKMKKYEKRTTLYSELQGLKILLKQFIVSRFEAQIYFSYYDYYFRLPSVPHDQTMIDDKIYQLRRSEELVVDVTRAFQRLFELLGSINLHFPRSEELRQLMNRLYSYRTPIYAEPKHIKDVESLSRWKEKAVAELQMLVEKEYGEPIDALLTHIENIMTNQKNGAVSRN